MELARIAGFLHDIGNVVNRADHAQSGAIMAFQLLTGMGMPAKEIGYVVSAIGHHDEGTAFPVNAIAAAVILADKSDVRRSRVRNKENTTFYIHDRVNYAVEKSSLILNRSSRTISLILSIDTGGYALAHAIQPNDPDIANYSAIILASMMGPTIAFNNPSAWVLWTPKISVSWQLAPSLVSSASLSPVSSGVLRLVLTLAWS